MTITLKNVPRALHQALKKQAKSNKRSLNQEVINCLDERVVLPSGARPDLLEDIRRFRQKLLARGFRPMTQGQLKAAIGKGRE